jgi:hypothetical protein
MFAFSKSNSLKEHFAFEHSLKLSKAAMETYDMLQLAF